MPLIPPTLSFSVILFSFTTLPWAIAPNPARQPRQLSVNYYARSCPQVEQLVASVTSQQFKAAPVSAPATIRLFFHDCFVQGCDASILISTKPGSNELAERDAEDNKDLRPEAFDTVNKAKTLVETKCPGVVSCADILAIATRDFVHLEKKMNYSMTKQPLGLLARCNTAGSAIIRRRRKGRIQPPRISSGCNRIKAMRAVIQRVASASVEVEGRLVSSIGPGLLVLVGLHESDVDSDADYICRKVLNMRLFPNENTGKTWDLNVMQKNFEVLLVSQFTLYGVLKGNKPDFHVAMPPDKAKLFYASVVEKFQKAYKPDAVKDGIFGAMMKVNLVNDGPVTMQLDSAQPSK